MDQNLNFISFIQRSVAMRRCPFCNIKKKCLLKKNIRKTKDKLLVNSFPVCGFKVKTKTKRTYTQSMSI